MAPTFGCLSLLSHHLPPSLGNWRRSAVNTNQLVIYRRDIWGVWWLKVKNGWKFWLKATQNYQFSERWRFTPRSRKLYPFLYRIYRHRVLSCRVKPFMVPSCVDNNNEFSLFCLMVCVNWEGEGSKKDAELKNYKYNIWLAMYRKVLAHHPGQSVSLARHKSNNDNKLIIINRASISFAPGPPPKWGPAKNDDDDDDTPHIIIVAIGRNEAGMKSRREGFNEGFLRPAEWLRFGLWRGLFSFCSHYI